MNIIEKIFGKKKVNSFLKKRTIDVDDIMNNNIIFDYNDLFTRKYDVVFFKGFFKQDEILHLKEILNGDELIKFYTQIDCRYRAIPPVFECLKEENKNVYFKNCEKDYERLNNALGYDVREKYIAFFNKIAIRNEEIRYPNGITTKETFQPGSFRIIPIDYGEIKIHADNNFYPKKSLMYNHIKSQVNLSNHVSYITLIQKPKVGGNLIIYNIEQAEYATINDKMEVISNLTGKSKHIDKFEKEEIHVDEGDLTLFSGGQLWHSVNKSKGDIERITHGGFSAYGLDKKDIFLWT